MADSYQVHLPYTHLLHHDDNSDPEHLYTLRADVWRRSIRPSLGSIAYEGASCPLPATTAGRSIYEHR